MNPYVNEKTMIWFAYKNYSLIGNPDYIGFNHYRRSFEFNDDDINEKMYFVIGVH